jgi:hypothetical protein
MKLKASKTLTRQDLIDTLKDFRFEIKTDLEEMELRLMIKHTNTEVKFSQDLVYGQENLRMPEKIDPSPQSSLLIMKNELKQ